MYMPAWSGICGSSIEYQQKRAHEAARFPQTTVIRAHILTWVLTALGVMISLLVAFTVSHKLGTMFGKVEHAKKELEMLVQERTQELRLANEKLEKPASCNNLTGLPNRSMFLRDIELMLSQVKRSGTKLGLLFIDLDGFKSVNDSYGHDYGDELLIQVSERLKAALRETDIIARLGGDEFTIILPNIKSTAGTTIIAEKIIDTISEPFFTKDKVCRIGSSIGISVYPDHGTGSHSLITLADRAMYRVKKNGKNAFLLHSKELC